MFFIFRCSLIDVAKSRVVVLDGAVNVPGHDDLFASVIRKVGNESEVVELLLVESLSHQRCRVHLFSPGEGVGQLLLGAGQIAIVGSQELLEDDLSRCVGGVVRELDPPHLGMA